MMQRYDIHGTADDSGVMVRHLEYAALQRSHTELLAALKALDALDDGDEPFAWKHEAQFENARAAIRRAEKLGK
jgi:aminoglycoside phosphotransferase